MPSTCPIFVHVQNLPKFCPNLHTTAATTELTSYYMAGRKVIRVSILFCGGLAAEKALLLMTVLVLRVTQLIFRSQFLRDHSNRLFDPIWP